MKVLIAEDEEVSRRILQVRLGKLGYEVMAEGDGESAWHAYLVHQPRIIITDWMMPEVDGLELCRRIRSSHREKYAYLILLTALSGKRNFLDGMEAGADDFMTKPVDMEELTARLRVAERILEMHTKMKQMEGLLPICSYCKKIRDDADQWQPIEGYIKQRTEATFSHGCCPSCREKYVLPQLEEVKARKGAV